MPGVPATVASRIEVTMPDVPGTVASRIWVTMAYVRIGSQWSTLHETIMANTLI